MREVATAVMLGLELAMTLAACGDKKEKRAVADAKAAGFVPPSVIARVDFGSQSDRRFRRLDTDGDDLIDKTEMPAANTRLASLDRNHDGRITATEFSEGMLARFDAMDLNKDGSVTSDEREASREAL